MAKIRDLLKCGGCGAEPHRLHNMRDADADRHEIQQLETTCLTCKSVTRLVVRQELQFEGIRGDGTLCGGW